MSKSNSKVTEMGVSAEPQVQVDNFVIEQYDDDIRPSRNITKKGNRPLSADVQVVYDRFTNAIDYAVGNGGKAQLTFPHESYPLKGRLANKSIANAIVSGKKRFKHIAFEVIVDAVNRDGVKLNASVVRFKVKETETSN